MSYDKNADIARSLVIQDRLNELQKEVPELYSKKEDYFLKVVDTESRTSIEKQELAARKENDAFNQVCLKITELRKEIELISMEKDLIKARLYTTTTSTPSNLIEG